MSYTSDLDYCESPAFYAEQRVKARKPHKCCDSGRIIQPSEMYWRIRMKFDGRICSYSQSEGAYHFARHVSRANHLCIDFGGVPDYVANSDDEALKAEWKRVCAGEITRNT